MRKLMVVAAMVFILMPALVWALDDTPENRVKQAERYLEATPPKDLLGNIAENMAKNLPSDQQQQFIDIFTRHIDMAALEKAMKEVMVRHFTADELNALADFYGSPVGKSAMQKVGPYMAELTPKIQAEVMKARERAQDEMTKDN